LIEVNKIVGGIIPYRINELMRELFRRYIENSFIRVVSFNLDSNGMSEVSFT